MLYRYILVLLISCICFSCTRNSNDNCNIDYYNKSKIVYSKTIPLNTDSISYSYSKVLRDYRLGSGVGRIAYKHTVNLENNTYTIDVYNAPPIKIIKGCETIISEYEYKHNRTKYIDDLTNRMNLLEGCFIEYRSKGVKYDMIKAIDVDC